MYFQEKVLVILLETSYIWLPSVPGCFFFLSHIMRVPGLLAINAMPCSMHGVVGFVIFLSFSAL